MNKENASIQIGEIYKLLQSDNISANEIEFYQENGNVTSYLIDGKYILKTSTSAFDEQVKLERVKSLNLTPKIQSYGTYMISGCEYYYMLIDYIQGNELWSVAQNLSDKEKYNIGKEISQFLNELHSISDVYYDIGFYIPTIPQYGKTWKEGHIEYAAILQNGLSNLNLELSSQQAISKAFEYIYSNIGSLNYQTGAKLLHNDFHPKNIIVCNGGLAGVIDWECSQFGEADFDLAHLFHWCIYPMIQENSLDILLKSILDNLRIITTIPDIEKRFTIYQLEHELNQIIWNGKKQEEERIRRINGWLNGRVNALLM